MSELKRCPRCQANIPASVKVCGCGADLSQPQRGNLFQLVALMAIGLCLVMTIYLESAYPTWEVELFERPFQARMVPCYVALIIFFGLLISQFRFYKVQS